MKRKILYTLSRTVIVNMILVYLTYGFARFIFFIEYLDFFKETSLLHTSNLLIGSILFDSSAIMYTNALWVLMVLFPLHLKENCVYHHICKCVFLVINLLAFSLNIMDVVYFRFIQRRTTISVFSEFEHERNLGDIFLIELCAHWYYVIIVCIVGVILWKLYRIPNLSAKKLSWKTYTPTTLLCLLLFFPTCIVVIRGGVSDARPMNINYANRYSNHPVEAGLILNTPFTLIRSIGKGASSYNVPHYFSTKEEEEAVFNPIHTPCPTHPFRYKNIVILILESFGKEYIGAYNSHIDDYKSNTPFLDSLISSKALTYKYSYANSRKSVDGMPSILSSIPMFIESIFTSPYSTNYMSGLADCLGKKGYKTAFFHGAPRGSMGFLDFARATKFQHYYGLEDYENESQNYKQEDYDGHWGISDDPFLQYFCHKMTEMEQPFMTTVFSLSSHHPFEVPVPYRDLFPEENPEMPIYKVVRYTDMALRKFFNTASQQPWFKNTIFVLTNDHTNMSALDEYRNEIGVFRSPVIFYDPSDELGHGIKDDIIAQQIDIMPTILEYLGYDQPYLSFGKDLFTTPADRTWAVCYLNGIYIYMKHGYALLFDGTKSTRIYALNDYTMSKNLLDSIPYQTDMEIELKAIIQQYVERMIENKLVAQ